MPTIQKHNVFMVKCELLALGPTGHHIRTRTQEILLALLPSSVEICDSYGEQGMDAVKLVVMLKVSSLEYLPTIWTIMNSLKPWYQAGQMMVQTSTPLTGRNLEEL